MKIENDDKDFIALVGLELDTESRLDKKRKIKSLVDFIIRYNLDLNEIIIVYKRKTNQLNKYRDPVTGSTWTGKGRPPKWFINHLQGGGKKEDLEI